MVWYTALHYITSFLLTTDMCVALWFYPAINLRLSILGYAFTFSMLMSIPA